MFIMIGVVFLDSSGAHARRHRPHGGVQGKGKQVSARDQRINAQARSGGGRGGQDQAADRRTSSLLRMVVSPGGIDEGGVKDRMAARRRQACDPRTYNSILA
jgi:hypothetical protein